MQVTSPDRDRVRKLAELRLERPLVLSLTWISILPSSRPHRPARPRFAP